MTTRYYWNKQTRSWAERPSRLDPKIHLISDDMDYLRSQATGDRFTSKAAYRADLKARGYVELGNDCLEFQKPAPLNIENDLRRMLSERG